MSTLKVSSIQSPSTTDGGLAISSTGAVSGGLPVPNRNLLYNGAMQVAQRGTSATGISTIGSGYNTADRWFTWVSSAGTWTQSIEADAPDGFASSLKMLCTTANASLTGSSGLRFEHRLEGQDLQRVAKGTSGAQQLTLSFWVKSNVTGTYIAALLDNDNSRVVSISYTVDASATWEYKTITFPADTSGALDNDNANSLRLYLYLAAGPDLQSGALDSVWATDVAANRAVGQTNLAAAVNNYWQITGVQLETGPVATEFEHRSFGDELARCQRYYYKTKNVSGSNIYFATALVYSSTQALGPVYFPVTMRAAATSVETTGTASDYVIIGAGGSPTCTLVPSLNQAGLDNAEVNFFATGLVSGQAVGLRSTTTAAYLAFNAEL